MDPLPDHGEKSYKGSGKLIGRKALVTGGDSGIGRAAVIAFAREGADVTINYLPVEEPDAKQVMGYIEDAGTKGFANPGDLKNEQFCKTLVDAAVNQMGGLDILVLNAARQISVDSLLNISTEQFDEVFKTNVYANFWLAKAALQYMKPGSSIIITISEQADNPSEDLVDYAATRAAMRNFTQSMAKQLGPKGIRVNCVNPGPFWTPLQISGGCPPEKVKTFGEWTSMGRPGQPAELASVYVQLADNSASYSTGQTYGANGGTGKP